MLTLENFSNGASLVNHVLQVYKNGKFPTLLMCYKMNNTWNGDGLLSGLHITLLYDILTPVNAVFLFKMYGYFKSHVMLDDFAFRYSLATQPLYINSHYYGKQMVLHVLNYNFDMREVQGMINFIEMQSGRKYMPHISHESELSKDLVNNLLNKFFDKTIHGILKSTDYDIKKVETDANIYVNGDFF